MPTVKYSNWYCYFAEMTGVAYVSFLTANNFVLDIGITTGGDMQLRVSLQTAIQDNLRLVVQFRDADPIRPSRAVENTLNDNFINQREFEYVIKNEELPYSRFQVQLAMEVNGQVGPFTNQSSIYGKRLKTSSHIAKRRLYHD